MIKVPVYNNEGKAIGEMKLEPRLFDVAINPEVVQQAVRTQLANKRRPIAHAKDRSEVRGGGRKPWRQKGTGRARHGSIRSPLWKGGGVTFGPSKDNSFGLKMNKKAKRKALLMCLTDKVQNKKFIVVEELKLSGIKTKEVVQLLSKLPVEKKILTVLPKVDQIVIKSARNIPKVTTINADSLNVVALLKHEYVVIPKAGVEVISKTYLS